MKTQVARPNVRKAALQMALGGVVGLVSTLGLSVLLPSVTDALTPSSAALLGTGLVYALMGLFVGLGVGIPKLGANILSVGDAEDLVDQRTMLSGSAVSCLALGSSMVLLALSGRGGLISASLAAGLLAASVVLSIGISIAQWRLYDELMRGISLDASAIMAGAATMVILPWATLAHLGRTGPINPLGLIAVLAISMLFGSFVAAGRRGLLLPPQ